MASWSGLPERLVGYSYAIRQATARVSSFEPHETTPLITQVDYLSILPIDIRDSGARSFPSIEWFLGSSRFPRKCLSGTVIFTHGNIAVTCSTPRHHNACSEIPAQPLEERVPFPTDRELQGGEMWRGGRRGAGGIILGVKYDSSCIQHVRCRS